MKFPTAVECHLLLYSYIIAIPFKNIKILEYVNNILLLHLKIFNSEDP